MSCITLLLTSKNLHTTCELEPIKGADAQKHPYLCYGALSTGDRTQENFQMHRTKFSLRTVPSGDTVPRPVDLSEASLQTKISCCMSTKAISCDEAWRNHPKRNVVPILQTRSCMLL